MLLIEFADKLPVEKRRGTNKSVRVVEMLTDGMPEDGSSESNIGLQNVAAFVSWYQY